LDLRPSRATLALGGHARREEWLARRDVAIVIEQIQRKKRVRGLTPQNNPQTRPGVEKKDQTAELKKN
jgi:hypothetical protein